MSEPESTKNPGTNKKVEFSAIESLRESLSQYKTPEPTNSGGCLNGTVITALIVILIFGAGAFYLYWLESTSRPKREAEKRAVSEMAVRYNADSDWWKKLEDMDEPYVSDIQEALVKKDARPVLLNAEVIDVVNATDKYTVHFNNLEGNDPSIRFLLECNTEHAKRVIEGRDKSTDYAVIALISSVRRPTREDAIQDLENEEAFIANGRCLDLMPID